MTIPRVKRTTRESTGKCWDWRFSLGYNALETHSHCYHLFTLLSTMSWDLYPLFLPIERCVYCF
jgi:hypothetical protein